MRKWNFRHNWRSFFGAFSLLLLCACEENQNYQAQFGPPEPAASEAPGEGDWPPTNSEGTLESRFQLNPRAQEFIESWCDRKSLLSDANYFTLQSLIRLTSSPNNCEAAAVELTQLDSLKIPGPIRSLRPLASLTNLRTLKISGNNWKNVDVRSLFTPLGNLTHLEELDLSFNQLESIESLEGLLPELTHLNLSDNLLGRSAPNSEKLSVANFHFLLSLDLSNNGLTNLPFMPSNLEQLFVGDNHLAAPEDFSGIWDHPIYTAPNGTARNLRLVYLDAQRQTQLRKKSGRSGAQTNASPLNSKAVEAINRELKRRLPQANIRLVQSGALTP